MYVFLCEITGGAGLLVWSFNICPEIRYNMIFLPSYSIHVSSVPEPAESHGSTVLPVKPEEDIPRFVRYTNSIFWCGIFQSMTLVAVLHMHI